MNNKILKLMLKVLGMNTIIKQKKGYELQKYRKIYIDSASKKIANSQKFHYVLTL